MNAAVFQPGRAAPVASDLIHELYLVWTARVFTWENEAPVAPIVTWFVDHRGHPVCTQSRRVYLDDNYHDWEAPHSCSMA